MVRQEVVSISTYTSSSVSLADISSDSSSDYSVPLETFSRDLSQLRVCCTVVEETSQEVRLSVMQGSEDTDAVPDPSFASDEGTSDLPVTESEGEDSMVPSLGSVGSPGGGFRPFLPPLQSSPIRGAEAAVNQSLEPQGLPVVGSLNVWKSPEAQSIQAGLVQDLMESSGDLGLRVLWPKTDLEVCSPQINFCKENFLFLFFLPHIYKICHKCPM